jgi:hypothetical protein
MTLRNAPRWTGTWWSRRTTTINVLILAAVLALMLFGAVFP